MKTDLKKTTRLVKKTYKTPSLEKYGSFAGKKDMMPMGHMMPSGGMMK